ncbi:MAG: hypothetical protein C4534_08305 [Gaiellales bacterium]|nr:MAG: hypothetical protein C4534_08305 [Gaiellales bacterium]
MSIIIDPNPTPIDGVVTYPEPPPGYRTISAYAYPDLFSLNPGERVDTVAIDFVSPYEIDPVWLRARFNEQLVNFIQNGEELLAYALHRGAEQNITIPNEICFMDHCWTPPWGGETVASMTSYRLWVIGRPTYPASPSVRPVIQFGVGAIIAIVLTAILALVFIVGIILVLHGDIKWSDIVDGIIRVLRAPGENVASALGGNTGPFMALGFTLVAAGIFLPALSTKIGVSMPVGPGQVQLEAGTSGGGASRRR